MGALSGFKLSYANVVATLALFLALAGSSYAAVQLANNSVTSKTIKNGQVASVDLAANAVSTAKVKNGSLLKVDFKAGQLPSGVQGPKGDNGTPGAQGDPGPSGVVSTHSFTGSIGTITGTGSGIGDWQFAGGTNAVTITGTQRITVTAVAALGASTAVAVNSDICFQPLAGAVTPVGNHLTTSVSTRQPVSAVATFTPGTGFYTVGACVAIAAGQSLDNNNVTNGWFIVTN